MNDMKVRRNSMNDFVAHNSSSLSYEYDELSRELVGDSETLICCQSLQKAIDCHELL